MKPDEIKKAVRKAYARAAKRGSSCCDQTRSSCCTPDNATTRSCGVGYSQDELRSIPEGADLGLGCGNPVAIASLQEGQTVLDLGAGGGVDCFLAANKVGRKGKVIGVDMTPEMIDRARANAEKNDYHNVEFRLGEIEHLPVADNSVDVVISNCVINLAADKKQVLKEAYRVLKSGGRIAISDLALLKELLPEIRNSIQAYTDCIGGAILLEEYKNILEKVGFKEIKLTTNKAVNISEEGVEEIARQVDQRLPEDFKKLGDYVVSVYIEGYK